MAASHTKPPLRDLTYEDYLAHAEDLEFSDEDYENFLEHHGVKGMKWGVRKAESAARVARAKRKEVKQKRTERKKARTERKEARSERRTERKEARAERRQERRENRAAKRADAKKAKNPASQLSDAQIKERVNRMNLEAQYNRLSKEAYGNTSKGKVESFVKKQGIQLLEKQVQKQANRAIDAAIDKALGAATAKAANKKMETLSDSPLGDAGKKAVSNSNLDRKVHTYGVGVENRIRTRIQGPQPSYSRVRNPRR